MVQVLGCRVIFIDYLGLVNLMPYIRATKQSKADAIGNVTKMLKALAQMLGVPIVILHQISRSVESQSRASYRPMLSDLKDSGAVEEDSVKVLLLYRPEYYAENDEEPVTDAEGRNLREIIECNIAKQRYGPTGKVYFRHEKMSKIWEDDDFNERKPTRPGEKKKTTSKSKGS